MRKSCSKERRTRSCLKRLAFVIVLLYKNKLLMSSRYYIAFQVGKKSIFNPEDKENQAMDESSVENGDERGGRAGQQLNDEDRLKIRVCFIIFS